jgi:hypothetical protein
MLIVKSCCLRFVEILTGDNGSFNHLKSPFSGRIDFELIRIEGRNTEESIASLVAVGRLSVVDLRSVLTAPSLCPARQGSSITPDRRPFRPSTSQLTAVSAGWFAAIFRSSFDAGWPSKPFGQVSTS